MSKFNSYYRERCHTCCRQYLKELGKKCFCPWLSKDNATQAKQLAKLAKEKEQNMAILKAEYRKRNIPMKIVTLKQRTDLTPGERHMLFLRDPTRICYCDTFDCTIDAVYKGEIVQYLGCYHISVGNSYYNETNDKIDEPIRIEDKPYHFIKIKNI